MQLKYFKIIAMNKVAVNVKSEIYVIAFSKNAHCIGRTKKVRNNVMREPRNVAEVRAEFSKFLVQNVFVDGMTEEEIKLSLCAIVEKANHELMYWIREDDE